MYHIRSFHSQACRSTSNVFLFCSGYKNAKDLNIWRFPFKHTMSSSAQVLHSKFASEDFFIFCYWLCIFIALMGLVEAIAEFVRVYSDELYEPQTFWNRNYSHIPFEYRRKARIFGTSMNIVTNILFLYGFSNFRHGYIYPWLIINGAIVLLEAIYGMSNFLSNKIFKSRPFASIIFLALRYVIVFHMMTAIAELTTQ